MNNKNNKHYDVIITGGSYAGLSAAMALGRALRKVLVIDSGNPCNQPTPHSHNFITQDGETPASISKKAKSQVAAYSTVSFIEGRATEGRKLESGFEIKTAAGQTFTGNKLLFATGVKDEMPAIEGFAACWGKSVLHCPYCHGYEVRDKEMAVIANGDIGFEYVRLIHNWTKNLAMLTNGKSTLTPEQAQKIRAHQIDIIEKEIVSFEHAEGQVQQIVFSDHSSIKVSAVFTKASFTQHCAIPAHLGCDITEQGFIKADGFCKTSVPGIYAAGDNTTMFRTVSVAIASGTIAGAAINRELLEESF